MSFKLLPAILMPMEKQYNHIKYEAGIYALWEKANAFAPQEVNKKNLKKSKKSFSIIMPPPNANEDLHIGHARFVAIEDILIRHARMKGLATLWLPGADHAGIETQYVFEKKLKEQGKSRFDYEREDLYKMLWDYVHKYKDSMYDQLKRLGASCDWSREKFTLDPEIIAIVKQTFKSLYDEGMVYRDEQLVNYCPNCGTSFSELEIDYVERDDLMYYLDYGTVTIATTRPETIFADVAIAVNPQDSRYKKLIGKKATIPLINRQIPIIKDSAVDKKLGTGALKVTPAHDPTDFEIRKRHNLPTVSVIDSEGKMINTPPEYIGLRVADARRKVVSMLKDRGVLIKEVPIRHAVATCYKCKNTIEPMISKQWFIKVKPLTKDALLAIRKKQVKFAKDKYKKIAVHWLKNLKDWNISRQIVWGIQIPAWRCDQCMEWVVTAGETPNKCPNCKASSFTQETDTFDTWFSSSQWPFATLMTTGKNDFKRFYPTSVMETAYDILPFWVIRMIMLGLYKTKNVPFNNVLIHGLVRDKNGQKISKSKGNVINPLVMVDKYGADALRMGLIWGTLIENDISLSEENIRGQRNFANKLWNVARFVSLNQSQLKAMSRAPRSQNKNDHAIIKKLRRTAKIIDKEIENYRLNQAAENLYNFIWKDFANDYLESTKSRRSKAQPTLEYILSESLKIAHPFMPFITEAIWQNLYGNSQKPLIFQSWPK